MKFDNSSFSHSGAVNGAPKFKMGSHDVTTPLSEMVCRPWLGIAAVNLCTKYEVSKVVVNMCPFDRAHMASFSAKIETMRLSCSTVFEISELFVESRRF